MSTTIDDITKATKEFADVRRELGDLVEQTNRRMQMIYNDHVREIKRLITKCAEKRSALEAKVAGAPGLFEKPRTIIVHGIKVGLCKGRGKIEWEDDAQIVKAIKKLLPDKQDLLIKKTEKPVKKALGALPAADLKRLGITVEETGDAVVIEAVDSNVDKLVKALFPKADAEEVEEAA